MIPLHDDIPASRLPLVTVGLIIACVVVFVWQLSLPPQTRQLVVAALGAIPSALLGDSLQTPLSPWIPLPATLVSSMFLHGGWMHLIGNMLYLWIFGDNVEDAMGRVRFIAFYVLCGVVAVLAHALPNPQSDIPMIGASGAISGVLGAYLLLFPRARILVAVPLGVVITTWRLSAVIVLGFWFLLQVANSLLIAPQAGGVAWGAHLGGFVAGVVLIPLFKRKGVRLLQPGRRR